jgi:plastocyanin
MKIGKVTASLFLAAILTGAAGCAPDGGTRAPVESSPAIPSTARGMPGAQAAAITVKDFGFGEPITVSPGAVVTVINQDTVDHTVTADQDQAFDVQVKGGGGKATFPAPSQPGTYAFHCMFHPSMHGTLTVK